MLGTEALDDELSFIDHGGTSIVAEQLAVLLSYSLGVAISGIDILQSESYARFLHRLHILLTT